MAATVSSPVIEERSRSTAHRGFGPAAGSAALPAAGRRVLTARGDNPFCGDELELRLVCAADEAGRTVVEEARFDGYACTLCLAAADVLMEHIEGAVVQDALDVRLDDVLYWLDDLTVGRTRKGCVELPLSVLARALAPALN